MSGTTVPCVQGKDPKSDTFRVAKASPALFAEDDLDGFVDEALDEHTVVPISEGTVQIRRFESPLLEPVPAKAKPKAPKPVAPSWIVQLGELVPPRHEKAVVAGVLFFFLFGVLSFLGAVTMLLFIL